MSTQHCSRCGRYHDLNRMCRDYNETDEQIQQILKLPYGDVVKDTMEGVKHDKGKIQYSLLPPIALREVVKVLTYGAKEYSRDNWRSVPDSTNRYTDAAYRHIEAWRMGEVTDKESSHHHLAHAICCLMFLIEEG